MKKLINYILIACGCLQLGACSKDESAMPAPDNSVKSGSITRFAAVGNYLYCINAQHLDVYDATNPADPNKVNSVVIDPGIETVFAYLDKLYVGSPQSIFIVDIAQPTQPVVRSSASHNIRQGCDPVIARGSYAYSTIRSGRLCGRNVTVNQLQVFNIANPDNPETVGVLNMNYPSGLSLAAGDTLFVCDGDQGVQVVDVANPKSPKIVKTIPGINAYDIIVDGTNIIVTSPDGFNFYDCSDLNNVKLQYQLKKG
jgi:hypothetical protein